MGEARARVYAPNAVAGGECLVGATSVREFIIKKLK